MGIPHLITYLRPFTTPTDLSGKNVVIDGPGLAYHVWYICLSLKPQARNPFEAHPSYRFVGDIAIRWLDELQAHGVCLYDFTLSTCSKLTRERKKIFFDGQLPNSKRPVRISRITGYTRQLSNYQQAWPQMIPKADVDLDSKSSDSKLFNTEAISSNHSTLPAAPFLVPAIIEALSTCDRYADLVEVIPGEADLYCANYIRTHDGIIFTGDSDLLIHELGDGAVTFFRDINVSLSTNRTSLTCVRYQVSEIIQRLGLPEAHGLLALAFEMIMDTHASFRELLQRAIKLNAISIHGKLYQDFTNKYRLLEHTKMSQNSTYGPRIVKQHLACQLKMLDPRVSEYILQFPEFAGAAQESGLFQPQSHSLLPRTHLDVFLPFLLDCPRKTSAWEMSTSVRQLAYGLVNLILPLESGVLKITEYRRLQSGSRGREWEVPTTKDLPNACAELHEQLERLQKAISPIPEKHLWRAIALFQDLRLHLGTDKPGLSSSVIAQNQNVPFRLTWESIHLSAQFQGSYYSFRILKQILSIVISYAEAIDLPPALHLLYGDLESLPTLREFPNSIDNIRNATNPEDPRILEIVKEILGIPLVDESIKISMERKEKTRGAGNTAKVIRGQERIKKKKQTSAQPDTDSRETLDRQKKKVNNIFELIATE